MSEFTHHDSGGHDYDDQMAKEEPSLDLDPARDVEYWFVQPQDNDCTAGSVKEVLFDVRGHGVDGPEAAWERMAFQDVLRALESFDVACQFETGATVRQLGPYLDEGRRVIFGADGPAIRAIRNRDHYSVRLTAIDTAGNEVTFSDGNPYGNAETTPLNLFERAWAQRDNPLIVTDVTGDHHPGPVLLRLTFQPHKWWPLPDDFGHHDPEFVYHHHTWPQEDRDYFGHDLHDHSHDPGGHRVDGGQR